MIYTTVANLHGVPVEPFSEIAAYWKTVRKVEHIAKIYQLDGNRIVNKFILFKVKRMCHLKKTLRTAFGATRK